MEKFKELSLEEMQEVEGGILPLLAGAVVLAGKAAGYACGLLAADILINWSSYEAAIDKKLAECKN
ncbi:class IIb bacteriocin, lactobin A/cerein 7B family [Algoriphagus faecimaris]|uniref:Class IIb bacteriocin, lactobin A/cerein 7B family n=1 Tax=Algoriphagus faecimaris TaxID=686796 RepID=A0A1G6MUL5_9BACT|nr:bacteriocin class II family protein [Algoriphagus faecimaris]SDC59298.1 class IIb bacteriocin, lactobin A/cerein 7B family [Algoriphagus faecimaris]